MGWWDVASSFSGYSFPAELTLTATGNEGQAALGGRLPISIYCRIYHNRPIDSCIDSDCDDLNDVVWLIWLHLDGPGYDPKEAGD